MRFHIIIPVHNRVERTTRVLECLRAQSYRQFTAYVVDDGSTDGTSETVREAFNCSIDLRILSGDGSLWWGGATHLGIDAALREAACDDDLVLMNDDIEFCPDLLKSAAAVRLRNRGAVFGPLVVDSRDRQTADYCGAVMKSWGLSLTFRPYEGYRVQDLEEMPQTWDVDFLGAQATFVPAIVARHIGNIRSDLLPHYHGDGEYSYRAKRAGCRVFATRELVVYHCMATTGAFNAFIGRPSLRAFWDSFRNTRSINHFGYKLQFARLCCPPPWLLPYIVSDTAKTIIRGVALVLLGHRSVLLRRVLNRICSGRGTAPMEGIE